MAKSLIDRVARLAVTAAGKAPFRRRPTGSETTVDGQIPHPEVRRALKIISLAPASDFETMPVEEARLSARSLSTAFAGRPVPVAGTEELKIPGAAGDIPARLYLPIEPAEQASLLVFFHGGGWTIGDLDTHDNLCRILANHSGSRVLSVDYRLAPEHKFPAAADDAYAAYRYVVHNADRFGVDSAAIAVGGDSAGGNLAAVVCQQARNDGEIMPAFQLLFVPATDLSTKRPSVSLFRDGYVLTEAAIDWYFANYVNSPEDALNPKASPMLAADLSGLPAAYIATAGFDPVRDDGEEYGRRLREAGVPVVLRRHARLNHTFSVMTGFGTTGLMAVVEAAAALRTGIVLARDPAVEPGVAQ